ncbi:MAG: MoaD/ThiS family protein [Aphanocapsa lilacina HA4352-LM1]|jgi:molybdopterin synthase sulfur carrier subunit|uniref:MoaD/ThiS family protein n=1 Tax=Gloeobacter morelensis MG652769 TaxID=2781736 RepID=A0ABY3PS54_9CYAN|nr:MoaD/ThiS family protein [Gloeobacter morelensis]MBW4700020.1 MoaD/ThiS family protein [Aphanocapsa lilacina HA4352-LM1]UFP96318.1 MoaD/ThiS family protein [Gloeobacter morelensis MG652769]
MQTTRTKQITVVIPTVLRKFSRNQDSIRAAVRCTGSTVAEVLASLDKQCPGIGTRLWGEDGELRRFVNFYVNDEDIRFLEGSRTLLYEGDVVSIVPALAGG